MQKTAARPGKVVSFMNMRNSLVNDEAQSFSHVPEKQESSKKQDESEGIREGEELMELPQLDEDSA